MSYSRPIKPARRAQPHNVSVVGGKTWGQRMSDKQQFKKSIRPDPVNYFAEKHMRHADTIQTMQKMDEGLADGQGKVYYMNTPEDSRIKSYLHELGKYQRPILEGMYNQHEELQEGAADMMIKRIQHNMA